MAAFLASLLGALLLTAPRAWAAPPRLIVLISVDTLRADRLREDLAPRLSRFAREAASFSPATVQATWTLPSHAVMLTSLLPRSHGAGGDGGGKDWRPLAPGARSVAQALHDAGWRTEAFVDSSTLDARWGFSRGFDRYARGTRKAPTFASAAKELASAERKPLFLFVHSNIVHAYAREKASAVGSAACPVTEESMLPGFAMRPAPESAGAPQCSVERRAYDRAVACMDLAVGRFLDAVAASPAGKDALVLFTSDHGEALCDPHPDTPLRGHGYPGYAEQIEVPLLVRPPAGAPGAGGLRFPARELDVAPTILDYAGVPAPAAFQGRSLRPAIEGRALAELPSAAEGDDWSSLRRGGLDLVRRDHGAAQLYDARGARPESEDLAARRPEDAAALGRELDALLSRAPRAPRAAPAAVDARLDAALKAEGYRR